MADALPPGLEPVTDPDLIATLEKSQVQIDKEGGEAKTGAYSASAIDAFNRAIDSGTRLLTDKGIGAAVGSGWDPQSWGSWRPYGVSDEDKGTAKEFYAGTSARDFAANLDAMKAQVFLPMVQSMKGMGALSNAEGAKLTAAIGALDTGMSEDAFKASLKRVIDDLTTYRDRAAAEGKPVDANAPLGAAAPPAGPDGQPREFGAPTPPQNPLTPPQQQAYDAWNAAHPNATAQELSNFVGTMKAPDGRGLALSLEAAQKIVDARNEGLGVRPGGDAYEGLTSEEKAQVARTAGETDKVGAGLMGAADTITMGALDKAGAAATAFRDSLAGKGSFPDIYGRQVMVNDAIIDQVQRDSPWWYAGGQIAGGVVLPTFGARTPAQLAKVSAAYGATYGAGSSDELSQVPGRVITGAGLGAATGWAGGKLLEKLSARAAARAGTTAAETPADRYARGQRFGLDLSVGDVRGMGAKATERVLDVQTASAGTMNAARQKLGGQIEDAVDTVASTYGSPTSFRGMGEVAQAGVRAWQSKFENVASKAYDAIRISPKKPAVLDNTRTALAELTTIFESNPKMAKAFENTRLNTYMEALTKKVETVEQSGPSAGLNRFLGNEKTKEVGGALSWQDLKAFRSRIGEEIGDQRFSDSPTKTELRRLYGALSDDMRATAASNGPAAVKAFERANTLYRQGQERIDKAVKFLVGDDGQMTPEKAAARIQAIVKSGKGTSDIAKLADIRRSLPANEAGDLASGIVRMLGQPNNSEGRAFNPQTFTKNYADMSAEAKNLLFGSADKDLRANLDDFSKVMGDVAANNSTRNSSNTAMGLTISAGTLWTTGPMGLLAQAATSYGAGKLWTNPKFVRWATGYARMARGAARAGRQPTGDNLTMQANLLKKIAASDPSLTQEVLPIRQSILAAANDNATRSAAAQDKGGPTPDASGNFSADSAR